MIFLLPSPTAHRSYVIRAIISILFFIIFVVITPILILAVIVVIVVILRVIIAVELSLLVYQSLRHYFLALVNEPFASYALVSPLVP